MKNKEKVFREGAETIPYNRVRAEPVLNFSLFTIHFSLLKEILC